MSTGPSTTLVLAESVSSSVPTIASKICVARRAAPFSGRARETSGRAVIAIAMVFLIAECRRRGLRFSGILASVLSGKSVFAVPSGNRAERLAMALEFDTDFDPAYGEAVEVAPGRRPADREQSRPVHLPRHQQLHRRARRCWR